MEQINDYVNSSGIRACTADGKYGSHQQRFLAVESHILQDLISPKYSKLISYSSTHEGEIWGVCVSPNSVLCSTLALFTMAYYNYGHWKIIYKVLLQLDWFSSNTHNRHSIMECLLWVFGETQTLPLSELLCVLLPVQSDQCFLYAIATRLVMLYHNYTSQEFTMTIFSKIDIFYTK